ATAPAREVAVRLAAEAGAHGVLLDTRDKDGRTLFDHVSVPALRAWIDRCRAHGLLVALAGSLDHGCVRGAAVLGPDVVGVRGAACNGGRGGRVDAERVRRLRDALDRSEAGTQVAAGT
ncbi:MAG TPA: (5-formylfuran-3-yl)methyl phosphate synthase, partial [Gemmatimonadales bacterium]